MPNISGNQQTNGNPRKKMTTNIVLTGLSYAQVTNSQSIITPYQTIANDQQNNYLLIIITNLQKTNRRTAKNHRNVHTRNKLNKTETNLKTLIIVQLLRIAVRNVCKFIRLNQ